MLHFKRVDNNYAMEIDRQRYSEVRRAWGLGWGLVVAMVVTAILSSASGRVEVDVFILPVLLGLAIGLAVVAVNYPELKRLRETSQAIQNLTAALDVKVGRSPVDHEVDFYRPNYGLVRVTVRTRGWIVTYFKPGEGDAEQVLQFGVFRDRLYDYDLKAPVQDTSRNRATIRSVTAVLLEGLRR